MARAKLPAARSLRPKRKAAATKRARRPSTRTPRHEPDNRQLQDMVASRGMRIVPASAVTETEEIKRWLELLAAEQRSNFDLIASRLAVLDEIRDMVRSHDKDLGTHHTRLIYLEQAKTAHASTLTEHHDRLSALEAERAKGTP